METTDRQLYDAFFRHWNGPSYLRRGAKERDLLSVLRHLTALSKANVSLASGLGPYAEEEASPVLGLAAARDRSRTASVPVRARLLRSRWGWIAGAAAFGLYNLVAISQLTIYGMRDHGIFRICVGMLLLELPFAAFFLLRRLLHRFAMNQATTSRPPAEAKRTSLRYLYLVSVTILAVLYNFGLIFAASFDLVALSLAGLAAEAILLLKLRQGRPRQPGWRGLLRVGLLLPGSRTSVLLALRARLEAGQTLSEAMNGLSRFFPGHYAGRLRAAEKSGHVAECLLQLSEECARNIRFKRAHPVESLYLVILGVAQISVAAFALAKIVPVLVEILREFNVPMPETTRALIAVGDYLLYQWPWVIVYAAGGITVAVALYRLAPGLKRSCWELLLRTPIVGPALRFRGAQRATQMLGELLGAGMPLPAALDTVRSTDVNPALGRVLARWRAMAENGAALSECAAKTPAALVPRSLGALAALGESADCLGESLSHGATHYDALAQRAEVVLRTAAYPVLLLPFAALDYFIVRGVFEGITRLVDGLFYAL